MFLGNRKDSVWEDWGTLGNIRETPPLGTPPLNNPILGGGFKYFLFSSLPGEMIQFDDPIFQMG